MRRSRCGSALWPSALWNSLCCTPLVTHSGPPRHTESGKTNNNTRTHTTHRADMARPFSIACILVAACILAVEAAVEVSSNGRHAACQTITDIQTLTHRTRITLCSHPRLVLSTQMDSHSLGNSVSRKAIQQVSAALLHCTSLPPSSAAATSRHQHPCVLCWPCLLSFFRYLGCNFDPALLRSGFGSGLQRRSHRSVKQQPREETITITPHQYKHHSHHLSPF